MGHVSTGIADVHWDIKLHWVCELNYFNCVRLFTTLWTLTHRLLCPWDSPGQNIGVGSCFPFPGDLPHPGIEPVSLASPAMAGRKRLALAPPGKSNIALPLLLLLLSHFSCVRLCATPWTEAYQACPSMGFSRQEHWSGLPFPSPMHESGKWKWSRSVVSDSQRPHGLQPTMGFSGQQYLSGVPLPAILNGGQVGLGSDCFN